MSRVTIPVPETDLVRFNFDKSCQSFLELPDEERIGRGQRSLSDNSGAEILDRRLFLHVGSGTNLFLHPLDAVFSFVQSRGLVLQMRSTSRRHHGCNESVFGRLS